jgi:hypothetical protein
MREEVGTRLTQVTRSDHDHAATLARAALGGDVFEAAYNRGHETPLDEAISEALDVDG